MGAEEASAPVESTRIEPEGAAVLAAWGCPAAMARDGKVVLPERFGDFGVAIIADLAVDQSGVVHTSRCRSAWKATPLDPRDLLRVAARPCLTGCGPGVPVAVGGPAEFSAAVIRLAARLHRAFADFPPARRTGVEAEFRELNLGRAVTAALAEISDRAVAGPGLLAVVEGCRQWAAELVAARTRRLRRDGLSRLGRLLEADLAPGRSLEAQRALETAELAIPGGAGDSVLCMFDRCAGYVSTALAAASAAVTRDKRCPWDGTAAVAVLPREIAVLLHAHHALRWSHVAERALVFADVVDPGRPGLHAVCGAAARLWDTHDSDPATVYAAAASAWG